MAEHGAARPSAASCVTVDCAESAHARCMNGFLHKERHIRASVRSVKTTELTTSNALLCVALHIRYATGRWGQKKGAAHRAGSWCAVAVRAFSTSLALAFLVLILWMRGALRCIFARQLLWERQACGGGC